jgi:AmiR/NasT family two-component response regulator
LTGSVSRPSTPAPARDLLARRRSRQAKGMIAADQGIGVDDAFKRVRQHARSRNANLHSVADAIVNLGLRLD